MSVVATQTRTDVRPPAAGTGEPAGTGPSRPARIESLTGLRIFAAVAVYLSHVGFPAGVPPLLSTFMLSGFSGVTMFFVLSGFVLSLNYFSELRSPSRRALWRFAVARFARVYPLYLLVLVYAIVIAKFEGGTALPWRAHALALQAWNPDVGFAFALNGPAWSISVEFFLYACFPLVVLALARLRTVRSLLIVAVVMVGVLVALAAAFALTGANAGAGDPGSAHRWLYRSPLTRLGDFTLGVVAAQLYLSGRFAREPGERGYRTLGLLAPGAALVFCGLMMTRPLQYTTWSLDVMYAVPAVVLIFGLAVAPWTRISRFLSRPTVVLLGASSYAFYLIHALMIAQLDAARWTVQLTPTTVLFAVLTFGIILAAAVGLHQLVENPVRRWIQRRIGGRSTGSGGA